MCLIFTNYPISLVAGLGMCVLSLTQTLMCRELSGTLIECSKCTKDVCDHKASEMAFLSALSGFSNGVNWLVFCAFHIGKAVEVTQLGKRLSLKLCYYLGDSLLGLGYAIMLSEIVLGAFVPSNTARGGGIVLPIVSSIAITLRSKPDEKARSNGGEFLMLCGAHANLISANLFPTGMAANPLIPSKAQKILGIEFSYASWFFGSIVPSAVVAILVPLYIYHKSYKNYRESHDAIEYQRMKDEDIDVADEEIAMNIAASASGQTQEHNDELDMNATYFESKSMKYSIQSEIAALGNIKASEWKLLAILVACLALWLAMPFTGMDTTAIAFSSVFAMLYLNVLSWDDVVRNHKSLDTFFWLGILIMMAEQLKDFGVSSVIGEQIANFISKAQLSPFWASIVLGFLYFYSMYIFSSLTAHIVAFVGPFMEAGKSLNGPPFLVTGLLCYFSTLCGCLTNFSSGPIVIYYSQGYCSSRVRWYAIGLTISILYLATYFSVGVLWWKILGWW